MFADLHVHSQYSDGRLTVQDIIKKAMKNQVSLISICDHNSIEAYTKETPINYDGEVGEAIATKMVSLVTGTEIQTSWVGMEYHILGYGLNVDDVALNALLQDNRHTCARRGDLLIEKMEKSNSTLSVKEFSKYERQRCNGGWNSIDYLKSKGFVNNVRDYFQLVQEYGAVLTQEFPAPQEVIQIIKEAGGLAVLAHLGESTKKASNYKEIAEHFHEMGIDGFECFHPSHRAEIIAWMLEFCRKHRLIVTGGSDDHGGFNNVDGGYVFDMSEGKVEIEQLILSEQFFVSSV